MKARKAWLVSAWIFTSLNFFGAILAGAMGEEEHAALHIALLFLGFFFVHRLTRGLEKQQLAASGPAVDDRLDRIEQSMELIGLEAERMSEAQRLITKLATERAPPPVSPLR